MDIHEEILTALQKEEKIMLATIISTTGSTPAAALSKMLITHTGIVSVGTVGGGCMEGDVLLHAHRLFDTGLAEILSFHLNEDDVEHGLICGGNVDVLIEPLTKKNVRVVEELKSIARAGEDCILATLLDKNGNIRFKEIVKLEDQKTNSATRENRSDIGRLLSSIISLSPGVQASIPEFFGKMHRRQETHRVKTEDGELILEPITGNPRLIIFGGGHVSKFVSRAAAMAGFWITIVDDREKFANSLRFPEANQTLAVDFLDAFHHLSINSSTYLVIVTRGHRNDEQILERALQTPARYIGMIGSKRKVLTIYEHLKERGVSVESLKRVHAPMGIDLGAVTAEEIGVSIVAELIHDRRARGQGLRHKGDNMNDLILGIESKSTTHEKG